MNVKLIGLLILLWTVLWSFIEFTLLFVNSGIVFVESNPLILGLEMIVSFVLILFTGWLVLEEVNKRSRRRKLEENFRYFS